MAIAYAGHDKAFASRYHTQLGRAPGGRGLRVLYKLSSAEGIVEVMCGSGKRRVETH